MDPTPVLLLAAGLVLLVFGAEFLVRGSSRLAAAFGIPSLVVGLTVVAFGTSAPELAVSVRSAWAGRGDLALGNAVGSNIFNVLFILGLSALIAPLVVARRLVRLDVPILVGVSVLLLLLALDGSLGRVDGALLFAGILAYTGFQIREGRRAGSRTERARRNDRSGGSRIADVAFVVGGLAALVLGARWLVSAAVELALGLGVSELVVGLTVVAGGTSLPEVATSVAASLRGQRDIAVGNVVGSNLFNILAVLGLAGLLAPEGVEVSRAALSFDLLVMLAAAVACLPIFFTGYRIARWEAALFLGYYGAYTGYLVLHAAEHPALPAFRTALLWFVLPLTAVTVLVVAVRALRRA